MENRETQADRIREMVDQSTESVEKIHRAVADLPLKLLERNNLFEDAVTELRRIQDRSIETVYEFVHEINHRATELAGDLLDAGGSERR